MRYMWLALGLVCAALSTAAGLWLWLTYWKLMSLWIGNAGLALLAAIATFIPFGAIIVPIAVEDGTVPDYSQMNWIVMLISCVALGNAAKWCFRRKRDLD